MNFGGSNGHKDICILVVDCNPSNLVTISRMLRDLTYQVLTVGRTADALAITLEEDYQVDLVMTELHMPEMDGVKLLDEIQRTTKLPVVIMSTDDDEDAMLRSLNKGAMYYMIKPVEIENLKNLWQYVFLHRREKQLQRTRHNGHVRAESLGENEPAGSGLITNHSKKHGYQEYTTDTEDTLTSALRKKKPKLVWTAELHNRFLFAIAELGLDNAHPKKILRIMGVRGLTKEQVSSHLQKYRLSVKRDRVAVNSGLELATRKTPIHHVGRSFSQYGNQSWHKFSHGIRPPHGLLAPTMASSQPGFTECYNMQRNRTSSSNIRRGQYCHYNCPGAGLNGVLNRPTAMDVNNGGRTSNGWDLFNNSIMLPPQPWMLPPPQQGGQGTGDPTFAGEPEADVGFCKRYEGNQRFPK